jgi:hypothetical protein
VKLAEGEVFELSFQPEDCLTEFVGDQFVNAGRKPHSFWRVKIAHA